MSCGIYEIVCHATGQRYIGQSVNLKMRLSGHRRDLRKGQHHCKAMQAAWDQFGPQAFTMRAIERVNAEQLHEREAHYMALYDTRNPLHGFNSRPASPSAYRGIPEVNELVAINWRIDRDVIHAIKIAAAMEGVTCAVIVSSILEQDLRDRGVLPLPEATPSPA